MLGDGGTLARLGDMVGEAVDSALGEVLTAKLAGVGVAVRVVGELGAAVEVRRDDLVRLPAHRNDVCPRRQAREQSVREFNGRSVPVSCEQRVLGGRKFCQTLPP